MSHSSPKTSWIFIAGITCWILLVAAGYYWMNRESFQAGAIDHSAVTSDILSYVDEEKPTLFVALHPECPCSTATLDELERISRSCEGLLKIVTLFSYYPTLPHPIQHTDLWKRSSAIPGLVAVIDRDGSLRKAVAAGTSGECRLVTPAGLTLYHGGITTSRGHSGASAGGDAIIQWVHHEKPVLASAPVFGCSL